MTKHKKRPRPPERPKLSADDFNQRLLSATRLMYTAVVEQEDRVHVNVLGGRATTLIEVTVVDDDVRFALGKESRNTEAIRRILVAMGKKQGVTVELNVFSAAKTHPVYRARGTGPTEDTEDWAWSGES